MHTEQVHNQQQMEPGPPEADPQLLKVLDDYYVGRWHGNHHQQ